MSLRRIHLHGPLSKLHQGVIELDASTVVEAINGLCRLLKIRVNPIQGRMVLKVVGFETVESLFEESDVVDLHIVPAFAGGKAGWVTVVIGAVLIAAAIFFPATLAALGAIGGVPVSSMIFYAGVSLVLGGLTATLFPVRASATGRVLGTPQNTTAIGTRIPLILGRHKAYGQYLSYSVVAVDQ